MAAAKKKKNSKFETHMPGGQVRNLKEESVVIPEMKKEAKPVDVGDEEDKLDPAEEKMLDRILMGIVIFILGWLGLSVVLVVLGYFGVWK